MTARSDANGRYRLLGLPTEGKIQVHVQPGKGQPYLRQSVEHRLRSAGEFPGRLDIPLARRPRARPAHRRGHETGRPGVDHLHALRRQSAPRSLPSALRRRHRVRRRARRLVRAGRRAGPGRRGRARLGGTLPRIAARAVGPSRRPGRLLRDGESRPGPRRGFPRGRQDRPETRRGRAALRRRARAGPVGPWQAGRPRRPPSHRRLGLPPDVNRPGRHRRRAAGARCRRVHRRRPGPRPTPPTLVPPPPAQPGTRGHAPPAWITSRSPSLFSPAAR